MSAVRSIDDIPLPLPLGAAERLKVFDVLAGRLLGDQYGGATAGTAFSDKLTAGLVSAGRRYGHRMSTEEVLRRLVGEEAVAHVILAFDVRPLFQRVLGVELLFSDVPVARRQRWRGSPHQLYKKALCDLAVPFVIARDHQLDGRFGAFWPYDLAMDALEAAPELRARVRRVVGRHLGSTLRVFVNGRIRRLWCVPEWRMLQALAVPEPPDEPKLKKLMLWCSALNHECSVRLMHELEAPKAIEPILDRPSRESSAD